MTHKTEEKNLEWNVISKDEKIADEDLKEYVDAALKQDEKDAYKKVNNKKMIA